VEVVEGTKLTVGGGPKCEIRLQGADVRPLHCVVIATPAGIVVRRWAEGTLLNGMAFTESALAAGDRLTIAGHRIDVVALRTEPVAAPVEASIESQDEPAPEVETPVRVEASTAAPVAAASEAPAELFDPAIPRRLLKPWSPSGAGEAQDAEPELSRSNQAPVVVPVAGEDRDFEPCPFGHAPAVVPAPGDTARRAEPEESAATAEPIVDNPFAAFLVDATAPPAASAAASLPVPVEAPPADHALPPTTAQRLARRVAAGRRRVASLVAALRASRNEARGAVAGYAVLQTDLASAMEAAQQAGRELAAMASRLAELEQDRSDATSLATSTLGELAMLQARVAELEQSLATSDRRTDALAAPIARPVSESTVATERPIEAVEPSSFATMAEPEPAGAFDAWPEPTFSEPDPSPAEPTDFASDADWPAPPTREAEGAEPFDAVDPFSAKSGGDAEEPWGIERRDAVGAAANLWDEPVGKPEPAPARDATALEAQESYTPPQRVAEQLAAFAAAETAAEESVGDEPSSLCLVSTTAFDAPAETEKTRVEAESFIDRFAHMLPDDDQPTVAPQAIASRPARVEPELATQHGDDDSIDDYMKKMMERIRGAAPAVEPPRETSRPAAPVAALNDPETTAATVPSPAPVEDEPVRPLTSLDELVVVRAPERGTDMGALRQLANQSARHNIDVADVNSRKERSTLGLVIAAVSLGCGTLAALMAPEVLSEQFIGGLIGVGFGGTVWMRVLRSMRAPKRRVAV
jgi:hypothetical protein